MSGESFDAHVQRGGILKEQGRYREAVAEFGQALAMDPEASFVHHQIAVCQLCGDGQGDAALASIRRALELEPNAAVYHATHALILSSLKRPKEGLQAAAAALELEPDLAYAFVAQADAHLRLEDWSAAERAAREALAHDPDDDVAANLLAQALRVQGKAAENEEQIRRLLARDPENSWTHANAGWAALRAGDRAAAQQHFLEALRLDPNLDEAREGLLEAFKARSPLYRLYQRFGYAMHRLDRRVRWAVLIGAFLAVRFSRVLFTGPWMPLGVAITVLYLLLCFWSHVAPGVGNLLVLCDHWARRALRTRERVHAVVVGGGLLGGIVLTAAGLALGQPLAWIPGVACVLAAIPFAHTFTNDSPRGRWLFGGIGALVVAAAAAHVASLLLGQALPGLRQLTLSAVVGVVLTTWLANLRSLRE